MKSSDLLAPWIAVALLVMATSATVAATRPPAVSYLAKRPAITSGLDDTGWIAQSPVSQSFVASDDAATFSAVGLPPGLVLDPKTGQVTGVLLQDGTFHVKVRAINKAGPGPLFTQDLHVAPLLTLGLAGTFSTILPRDPTLNDLLGGTLSFISTPSGAFSGKIRLGKVKKGGAKIVNCPFTGTFIVNPDDSGQASATILVLLDTTTGQQATLTLTVQNETNPADVTGVVGNFTYVLQRDEQPDIKGTGASRKPDLTTAQTGRWSAQVERATQNNQMIADPSSWVYPAGILNLQIARNATLTTGLRLKLSTGQTLVVATSSDLDPHLETSLFVVFPNSVPARSLLGHLELYDDLPSSRLVRGELDYGNSIAVEDSKRLGTIWEYFLSMNVK